MSDRGMSRRRMFGIGVAAVTSVAAGYSADNANTPTAQSNTTTTTTGGNAAGAPVEPVTAALQAPPAVTPAVVAARHAGTPPQLWGRGNAWYHRQFRANRQADR